MNVPYIPGNAPPPELPLGRFLPPIPEGMISSWCQENLRVDDPVLEPFGFTPLVPIEIALSGHPVLVTVNNPIHAFRTWLWHPKVMSAWNPISGACTESPVRIAIGK